MKKFFALCFTLLIMCTALTSTGWAGYSASEYQDKPYTDYLKDCYKFVKAVIAKEQNFTDFPSYDDTMRYYPEYDNYLVGDKLLNTANYTATTTENIKALFNKAEVGDVVQMYLYTGDNNSLQHTAIVSAIDKQKSVVCFLHSGWPYYSITNTEFSYSTIARLCTRAIEYKYSDDTYKYGGISLYRFSLDMNAPLPEGSVRINNENFPDDIFRDYIFSYIDNNGDRILSAEEAASVTYVDVSYSGIANLKGIEYFTALATLWCSNNQLTELDVSKNTALTYLNCSDNQITSLDLRCNTALADVYCDNNELNTLNANGCTVLRDLWCWNNKLISLDVGGCTVLTGLHCWNNQLTAIDISNCISLEDLSCKGNKLTELDVRNCRDNIYVSCDWVVNIISADNIKPRIVSAFLVDPVPDAITGQTYIFQPVVRGTIPITWTLKSGKLPAGLVLHVSGIISGTPQKAGKYTFTVAAANSYGTDTAKFTLTVYDPVSISTASLKAGTIGKSYSVTIKAKGSKTITWNAEGLPKGLSINTKGKISGKPTAYGDFTVKITATNPAGSITKTLNLRVKAIAPKLAGNFAKLTLNEYYSSGLNVTGSYPITWSIEGKLPDGLTFYPSSGIIAGTPKLYAKSGYKLTITASNDAGKKSKKITLKVNAKAPRITTSKLPEATVNQSYSFALSATGSEPITFTAENLPEGLHIDGDTITGTPAESGTFRVTIHAENPVKTVKKSFTLKINADNSNTQFPAVKFSEVTPNIMLTDEILPESISGGYVFSLGEVSCDESGMYDFELEFPDYVNEGSELVYAANSESPSDDDDIAEFFDDTGEEISAVPESRKITVSIWLNEGVIYKPVVVVKK